MAKRKKADKPVDTDKPIGTDKPVSDVKGMARAKHQTYAHTYDAEGVENQDICPACQSSNTITYLFHEGFSEIECYDCGFSSEAEDISDLTRYQNTLLEGSTLPPIPLKKMKA